MDSPSAYDERNVVLLPPSAVPHISHEIALGDFMTASPRGEKPCSVSNMVHSVAAGAISLQRLLPRGRSCRKSALRNRILTDVGDCAAKAAQKIPAVQNTPQCVHGMFQFLTLRHDPRRRSGCPSAVFLGIIVPAPSQFVNGQPVARFLYNGAVEKLFLPPLAFGGELE